MSRFEHEEYNPRHDLADRLRNRFDVESYDVYEFHGDNNGDPDSGASDDQTSVSGAAGASTSLPDCAPEDEACHPHRAFQSYGYPGYGPSVPPGYPHGPFVEPDMGNDGMGYIAPPVVGGYAGRPAPPTGFMGRLRHHLGMGGGGGGGLGGYGGQAGMPTYGGMGAPPSPGQNMYMKSWERWQQVHANRGDNTWQHYQEWLNGVGQAPNATINGESMFGGEESLGDEDLVGGFDMKG